MEPAELSDGLDSRPQIKMIGIAEKNLDAEFFEDSWGTAFTVAAVPTGMNTGVSISPCGVSRRPPRAAPERASILKSIDIVCDCSNAKDLRSGMGHCQLQQFTLHAAIFYK